MGKIMQKEDEERLQKLAQEHGFYKRGKAYFRVIGDGVLQIIKFEYEHVISQYDLSIGLMSMYGELMEQWFTSGGCITRYGVYNLIGIQDILSGWDDGSFQRKIFTHKEQLDILERYGFFQLDQIQTQEQLAEAICQLDLVRGESVRWNDMEKFDPYLKIRDLENAKRVIQAILDQHAGALENRQICLGIEEFAECTREYEAEDSLLKRKLELAKVGSEEEIQEYLDINYQRNCKFASFWFRKKDRKEIRVPDQERITIKVCGCSNIVKVCEENRTRDHLPSRFGYQFVTEVVSKSEQIVKIGGIYAHLDGAIPEDIEDGDYISCLITHFNVDVESK